MTEPLAVAVHGFRLAARLDPDRPTSGERVVVLGAGIIGLLSVFYAKRAGSREVAVTAKYPFQAEAAVAMGADHVFGTNKTAQDELAEWAATHPVDVVIETVGGAANTPAEATRIVRSGGRIALLGIFTNDIVLPSAGLTLKEPRIVFPFGYSYIGPHADYQIAVDLLGDEPELLGSLITHRFSLDSVAEMMQTATDKAATGAIKVVVEH
jgi:threonine dehydrogenase-like Zn-dependent dehydrogenase